MRCRWNGVRCVAVAWLLLALSPASSESGNRAGVADDSPTDSLRLMRDRMRRHGPLNPTSQSTPRGGYTSQCSPQCFGNASALELKRNYRLDSVKDDILRKLRMNQPPNVTGRMPHVNAMQTILNQIQVDVNASANTDENSLGSDHIHPTTLILLSQTMPPEKRPAGRTPSCYFPFSPDLIADQVITAKLFIYLRNSTSHAPQTFTTWFLIYRIGREPNGVFNRTLHKKRKITTSRNDTNQWYEFDARTLVENWIRHPGQNYGIQVQVSDHRGSPLAVLPESNETQDVLRPYIEIKIVKPPSNRPRRSADSDCVEANADPRCCRYPLTIDFDVFRWDWVIAPKRYEAYYCSGECPFLFYQRQTHTHVVSQMTGGLGVPCCAPTVMSSLQMIYIDSGHNIVFGTLPGMIVEKCGCS